MQSLAITVTGVEGMVQVREGDGQPWRKAVAGMTVGEGAEFRTGPRSAVRCLVPPDQTFTLDRLGVVKVLQAIRDGKVVKTKVGMPFGRTRYDIEAAGVEHQTSMVTPSSTLAIRGTRVSVFDQPPFAPSAVSLTGRAEYRTAKRQIAFGGKGEGRTDVSSQIESPGELSLLRSYVDPASHFGRPDEDERLISQLQAKGDLVLRNGELAVAFGGPVTDRQLVDITRNQGRFNIALRWFGPGDFDLFVLTPDPKTGLPAYTLGNPSYRGSIFKDIGLFQSTTGQDIPAVTAGRTADGGRIRFDQIAFGKGGLELASWNTPVPQVPYTIAVAYYNHLTEDPNYPASGSFQVDAFLDGKRVPLMQNYQAVRDVQAAPVFGPVYQNTVQLLGRGSTILVNPPSDFNGQFDLTSADLSPEAAGNINPSSSSSRSARRSRDKSVTAAAAQPSGRARRR
ncbi:MAG TPA: hypothetical protein VH475_26335 [Tepidisphaeraceae bacterium]